MVNPTILTTLKCIQAISSRVYAFEYLGPQEVLFGEVVETWKVRLRGRKYVTLGFEVYSFSPLPVQCLLPVSPET